MAQSCEVCGFKPATGNQVTIRGKAKYLGGVGTKITGISRRTFRPNLQTVHITTPGGSNRTARVCTRCIRVAPPCGSESGKWSCFGLPNISEDGKPDGPLASGTLGPRALHQRR